MNSNITPAQKHAQLPENPIGTLELTDTDLALITGAFGGDCGSSIHIGLGINLGGGCGSYDPEPCDDDWAGRAHCGGGFICVPIPAPRPCHRVCFDPCR